MYAYTNGRLRKNYTLYNTHTAKKLLPLYLKKKKNGNNYNIRGKAFKVSSLENYNSNSEYYVITVINFFRNKKQTSGNIRRNVTSVLCNTVFY